MAANNFTPIQLFRSRTTGVTPNSFSFNLAVAALANQNQISVATSALPPSGVLNWAVDAPSIYLANNATVVASSVSGSNTVLTLSSPILSPLSTTVSLQLQQLREGELFINTEDFRVQVGAYPQTQAGNSDTLGIIDLIPSIKTQAGRALRVSDDGLRIEWGNVTAAGGNVTAVWAGQQTNPITQAFPVASGITTSPGTIYTQTTLSAVVTAIATQLADQTWDITLTSTTGIFVGNVLAATATQLNNGQQARVNLVRSGTVINVSSTITASTPWGTSGNISPNTVIRSGLSSSGIQGTGFVGVDLSVLPYMQNRNLNNAYYADYTNSTFDTGITPAARNPASTLPAPLGSITANVVHPLQGGLGIAANDRQDIVNAAHPQQQVDVGTYVAKTYTGWQSAGFTPYTDSTYYFRVTGSNGVWAPWTNTNRMIMTSNGVDASWVTLPQPIQNTFFRLTRNDGPTRVANKGIYRGAATWLGLQQNAPDDNTAGGTPTDRVSTRPDNQDLIVDLIQTGPVPIASGGTGIDLRDPSNTYWDTANSRLKTNIAWSIPAYGTSDSGELQKILPPFMYTADANNDPTALSHTPVLAYKGVQQLPQWSDTLGGLRLQGYGLPASNTFTNAARPLTLEGLGRFGIWQGVNSYAAFAVDGLIQTSNAVADQDLTLQGQSGANTSRLILDTVTTPNTKNRGLVGVRIDGGLPNVNGGVGSSVSQIAEDYSTFTLTGNIGSQLQLSGDYLAQSIVYSGSAFTNASSTSLNIELNHTGTNTFSTFCGPASTTGRAVSGLIIFSNPALASISRENITITTNFAPAATIVLRPLAGIVSGQYLVISWVANGQVVLITVATGN